MEGFGSEVTTGAIVLLLLNVARAYIKERRERRHAVKVINGSGGGHNSRNPSNRNPGNRNPGNGRGGTSTDLVLHLLEEHGEKLHKLDEDMTDVRVELAKIETRLNMKEEKL
jgi:hypothetical protein